MWRSRAFEGTEVWRSGWTTLWTITEIVSHCRTKSGRCSIVLKIYMLTGPDLDGRGGEWGLHETKTISTDFTETFVSLKSPKISLCFLLLYKIRRKKYYHNFNLLLLKETSTFWLPQGLHNIKYGPLC
jgi:hypothetical protein